MAPRALMRSCALALIVPLLPACTAIPSVREYEKGAQVWKKALASKQAAQWHSRSADIVTQHAPFILQNRYQHRSGRCRPYC